MPNLSLLHISIFHCCLASFDVRRLETMPKKLREECFRGRQRQPEQVHASLPNLHRQESVRTIPVMHAPAPAHQRPPMGRLVRPAAVASGLAPVRSWHVCSERSEWCAFGKLACTCSGCRCRPRKHFSRSFFGIVTHAKRRKNISNMPEIGTCCHSRPPDFLSCRYF